MNTIVWVATLLATVTALCPRSKGQLLGCHNDNGMHIVEYDYTVDPPQVCGEYPMTIQGEVGKEYKCQGMTYMAGTDTLYAILTPTTTTTTTPTSDVWVSTIDLATSTVTIMGSKSLGLPVVELFTYGDRLYGSVSGTHPATGYYPIDALEGTLGPIAALATRHQTPYHGVATTECLRGYFRLTTSPDGIQGHHHVDSIQETETNQFTTDSRAEQYFPGNPSMVYSATVMTGDLAHSTIVVSTSQGVYFNYGFNPDPSAPPLRPNTDHLLVWGLTHLAPPVACKNQHNQDKFQMQQMRSSSPSSSPSSSSSPSMAPTDETDAPGIPPSLSPSDEPAVASDAPSVVLSSSPSTPDSPEPSASDTPSPFSLQPAPGIAIDSPVPTDVTITAACSEVRSVSTSVVCTLTASAPIFKSNLAISIPRGFTITFPFTFQTSVFVIIWIGPNDGDMITISTQPPLVIETASYTVANDDPPIPCNQLAQGGTCQPPATVVMGRCQCPMGSPCEATGECTMIVDTDSVNTATITGGRFRMTSTMVEATMTQMTVTGTTIVSSTTSQSARVNRVRVTRTVMRITIRMTMVVASLTGPCSVESTTVVIMVRVTVVSFVHLTPFAGSRTANNKFYPLQAGSNFTVQTSLTVGTPTMTGQMRLTVPTLVQGTTLINMGSALFVENPASFCGVITLVSSEVVITANTTIKANVLSNGAGRLVVNQAFLLLQTATMVQAITVVMTGAGNTPAGVIMEVPAVQNSIQVGPGMYIQNLMQQATVTMQDTFRMEPTGIIDLGNVTTTSSPITTNVFDTVGDYTVILRPVTAPQASNRFRVVTFTSRTGTGAATITFIPPTTLPFTAVLSGSSLDAVFADAPTTPPVPTSATAPPVNPAPPQSVPIPAPVLTTTTTTNPPPSPSGGGSSVAIPVAVSVGVFVLIAAAGGVAWRVLSTDKSTPGALVPKPTGAPQQFFPGTPASTPFAV